MGGIKKKTEEDYRFLAKQRGFQWIDSELPKGVDYPSKWLCPKGHEWMARYQGIQRGDGCRYCAMSSFKTINDYRELAASCNFEWVASEVPKTTKQKTRWRCFLGHEWEARYSNIRSGHGCPYCANNLPKSKNDYRELAVSRSFEWLAGEIPTNTTYASEWRCLNGHTWMASYSSIQSGNGCPHCANFVNGKPASKVQIALAKRLGGEVNFKDCDTHIDVVLRVSGVNIAVEYDGHYWHKDTQEHDAMVTQRLIDGGWRVLRIKGNKRDDLPTNGQMFDCIHDLINGWTYVEIDMAEQKAG